MCSYSTLGWSTIRLLGAGGCSLEVLGLYPTAWLVLATFLAVPKSIMVSRAELRADNHAVAILRAEPRDLIDAWSSIYGRAAAVKARRWAFVTPLVAITGAPTLERRIAVITNSARDD